MLQVSVVVDVVFFVLNCFPPFAFCLLLGICCLRFPLFCLLPPAEFSLCLLKACFHGLLSAVLACAAEVLLSALLPSAALFYCSASSLFQSLSAICFARVRNAISRHRLMRRWVFRQMIKLHRLLVFGCSVRDKCDQPPLSRGWL